MGEVCCRIDGIKHLMDRLQRKIHGYNVVGHNEDGWMKHKRVHQSEEVGVLATKGFGGFKSKLQLQGSM